MYYGQDNVQEKVRSWLRHDTVGQEHHEPDIASLTTIAPLL